MIEWKQASAAAPHVLVLLSSPNPSPGRDACLIHCLQAAALKWMGHVCLYCFTSLQIDCVHMRVVVWPLWKGWPHVCVCVCVCVVENSHYFIG